MTNDHSRISIEYIRSNVKTYGHHVNLVTQEVVPRYAYTVGLLDKLGYDLVLPGSAIFSGKEVYDVIELFANSRHKERESEAESVYVDVIGEFSLAKCHNSWIELLANAALGYYQNVTPFMQIVPPLDYFTIDIPNLSTEWSADQQPVWQWLTEPWLYPVSNKSTATTNIDALKGGAVTEAARWEEDEWEMFCGSGPETSADVRIVPLATLVGHDRTLEQVINLDIGGAVWRDHSGDFWKQWIKLS